MQATAMMIVAVAKLGNSLFIKTPNIEPMNITGIVTKA